MILETLELDEERNLSKLGLSLQEQAQLYEENLQDVIDNPSKYLDKLHLIPSYRVGWKDYRSTTPTAPYWVVEDRN